ncbi:MAG: ATPase, T2SS/T4P/T4SS family [Planctomycetota bacterium]
MSAGNIDDILARIQRLESAAGPDSPPHAPADGAPDRTEDTATESPGMTADPVTDPVIEADAPGDDILTPETYTGPDASGTTDPAAVEPSSFEPASFKPDADMQEDDDDLFTSDAPSDEPFADIEPPVDDEPEPPVASAPGMMAIDPDLPDDDSSEGAAPRSSSEEPTPGFHADRGAMASIEPEAAPSASTEPAAPAATPTDSDDGDWFVGNAGLQRRGESSATNNSDDHEGPGDLDSPGASSPAEGAASTTHPTDGMISINPGGAGSAGMSALFTPDSKTLGTIARTLGDHLADAGISREQISAAEKVAASTPGKDVAIVLVEQGADEVAIQSALARHHGLPFERIDLGEGFDGAFDGAMLQRLGMPFCAEHGVLPIRMDGKRAVIASARPDIAFELDEVRRRLNCGTPKVVLTTRDDIKNALELAGFGADKQTEQEQVDLNAILEEVDENDVTVEKREDQTVDLEQKAGESPVIRYVNYIIQTAVKEGASDIHIEPAEKKITVRLRIDGVLYESMNPPANMSAAITSRIKIMANLDISERRVPQDGRIRATVQGRKLDLRVSTLPCGYGEKVVMRILDTKSINVQLEDLGFDDNTLEIWKHQVKQPHGIVLVTGPTGSGKTTTLYSSLRQLDKNRLNISTAEDPIEYHLDGITQTQTHEKIGMTFSKVLKALLRQDPDVIMLGEIRDMETASIAVQASLTGHLVLSTLHTNDAPSSVTRLVNIGLEPFLVGAAVNAVLAQRLVRRLCPHCKELRDPPPEQIEFLELSGIIGQQVYQPVGCEKCRQGGYSGRVGIYELLAVDDQLRDVIARNPNVSEFRRMCLERGMHSLRQDGMSKVAEGVTTVAEVLRVTAEH